jgi:formiminoglutamase
MKHFNFLNKQDILALTELRRFETKLGEKVQYIAEKDQLETALGKSLARYVVFGIPEDIGVRANLEQGSTETNWLPFLRAFVNQQSSDFLNGEEILLLGHFDFTQFKTLIESNAHGKDEMIEAYRHAVNFIDEEVESLVKLITSQKKIPIAIGGGHNNAYPLIKGAAKGLYKSGVIPLAQINCVNLDAHTDYRPMEGRHSGNGFRYADEDGYLQKYFIVGVHENYIPQNVWLDIVNNPFIDFITYEDIFIHEKRSFTQAVADGTSFTGDTYTGIEIDLDCLENAFSGALTPSGISVRHARHYANYTARDTQPAYLHICEGAAHTENGKDGNNTGKLISYLVSDFIKALI